MSFSPGKLVFFADLVFLGAVLSYLVNRSGLDSEVLSGPIRHSFC